MKKTLALLLAVIFIIGSLTACGTQPTTPNDNENSTPSQTQSDIVDTNSNNDETPNNNETPADTTPDKNEIKDENSNSSNNNSNVDYAPGNNYFLNENNNFYDKDAVSVRPKYVYWHDGKLVAECFVVNGFDHPVFNINVKKLSFSNGDGLIAEGAFGKLDGVTLQPHTHIVWTFTFSADCIAKYGADITSLIYNSNVSNNY